MREGLIMGSVRVSRYAQGPCQHAANAIARRNGLSKRQTYVPRQISTHVAACDLRLAAAEMHSHSHCARAENKGTAGRGASRCVNFHPM